MVANFCDCSYATRLDQNAEFQLAIEQYAFTPYRCPATKKEEAVTIIAKDCLGDPYEPLRHDLLKAMQQSNDAGGRQWMIRGICAADMAHQGVRGVANEHLLGDRSECSSNSLSVESSLRYASM